MERDTRRDRGQWRGCYTFQDATREDDAGNVPKRNGGLKMGNTYYYYVRTPRRPSESPVNSALLVRQSLTESSQQYEVDGSSETYDPTQPSTTTCPYLPGQPVNTLYVPVEKSLRRRSASLTSLRSEDFRTMDPASKFIAPRPAPSPPEPIRRLGTAPPQQQQRQRMQSSFKRPSRSPSPSSRWVFSPRRLFSRKSSSSSLAEMQSSQQQPTNVDVAPTTTTYRPPTSMSFSSQAEQDTRSLRSESATGSRSRDISPESLRRFLLDDTPLHPQPDEVVVVPPPTLQIPEDIAEELEDDDNFATSAVSTDSMLFTTGLSPPPPPHAHQNKATTVPAPPTRPPPRIPSLDIAPAGSGEVYDSELLLRSPSAESTHSSLPPEFDDLSDSEEEYDEDEEEDFEVTMVAHHQHQQQIRPMTAATVDGKAVTTHMGVSGDAGLGELVSELGWMADVIRP
ncbi:hypothetical protein VTJ04DRAFT_429 [Mycothermus thermophilus]|uniref:uncharacterized protein n=1 Tax=Humicola insolens TaxID=85995 RepID=UPI003742836E